MGRGKSRRRREANYLAAHPLPLLPPPPPPLKSDGGAALPAKLRRIMHLRSPPGICNNDLCKITCQDEEKAQKGRRHLQKEQSQAVWSDGHVNLALKDTCGLVTIDYQSSVQSPKPRKRKQGESLITIMENLKCAPVKKGLKERKKRYLNEKPQKGKRKKHLPLPDETDLIIQKREKICFGDVVREPPKLMLPNKTKSISQERMRWQAIEGYRQRKGWTARPGNHKPPLVTNIALF